MPAAHGSASRRASKWIHRAIVAGMVIAALGVGGLGAASYWKGIPEDELWIGFATTRPQIRVAMIRGTLHGVCCGPAAPGMAVARSSRQFGPFYLRRVIVGATRAEGFGVPFWAMCLPILIYPALVFARGPLRRRRRHRLGQCVYCGYNLTGNVSGTCPECGEKVIAAASKV